MTFTSETSHLRSGTSSCSVHAVPCSSSSQVGEGAQETPDTAVGARARCHVLKEQLAGFLVHRPVCSLLVMQILLVVLLVVFSYDAVIDAGIEEFMHRGPNASLYQSSFKHAWVLSRLAPRNKLLNDTLGLIDGVPHEALFSFVAGTSASYSELTFVHFSVHIIYHRSGANVLTEKALYAIQQYEDELRAKPLWRDLCQGGASGTGAADTTVAASANRTGNAPTALPALGGSCDPGESLVGFVWPEPMEGDPTPARGLRAGLRLSGRGSQWLPVEAALSALGAGGEALDRVRRFLPQEFSLPDSGSPAIADALQSHFLFSLPVGASSVPGARYATKEEAQLAFHKFLSEELHPALDGSELLKLEGVSVYAHGTELQHFELLHAFHRDCCLVIGSVIFAVFILWSRARSILLTFFGLLIVWESLLLSYVIFRLIAGTPSISMVNSVALFMLMGLGSDVAVFEFLACWQWSRSSPKSGDAGREGDCEASIRFQEACHTRHMRVLLRSMCGSSGSCLLTTVCVASSFLGCLTSTLQTFREVGLFLGLSVACSSLLVVSMYPLAIVALENWRFRRGLSKSYTGGIAFHTVSADSTESGHVRDEHDLKGCKSKDKESRGGLRARALQFAGELWQAWASSLHTLRLWLLGAFAVLFLTVLIGTAVAAYSNSALRDMFPEGHNQVDGRRLRDRFGTSVTAVASSPHSQDASVCDLMAPQEDSEWEDCRDSDLRCGAWASMGQCGANSEFMQVRCPRSCGLCGFCLLRRCGVDEQLQAHAEREGEEASQSGCKCYADDNGVGTSIHTTVVGLEPALWSTIEPNLTALLTGMASGRQTYRYTPGPRGQPRPWKQPPLVQQHWRSGRFVMVPTFEAPVYSDGSSLRRASVEKKVVCYCGGAVPCKDAGMPQGGFDFSSGARRLTGQVRRRLRVAGPAGFAERGQQPPSYARVEGGSARTSLFGRRLAEMDLARASREVSVVWGLLVQEPGPFVLFPRTQIQDAWYMDGMFQPSDPWVQRSMMVMCSDLPAELRAVPRERTGMTWLHSFEQWLLEHGEEFPSRDFHRHMAEFLVEQPIHQRNVLIEDGMVRAAQVTLSLDVPTSPTLLEIVELKDEWDRHVEAHNQRAGLGARNAWHTSDLWVLLETHNAIARSIWLNLLVCVIVAVIAAAVHTRDVRLTLLSLANSVSVMLGQAFLLAVILRWAFGVVEAVAFVFPAGQAFAAGLRIAVAYSRAPANSCDCAGAGFPYGMRKEDGAVPSRASADRYRRTLYALESVGWYILSSAGMMLGTCFFMLLCTLQFHVKFGVAMFSVAALSLVHSLLFLPVLLLLAGPTPRGSPGPCQRRLQTLADRCWPAPAPTAELVVPVPAEPALPLQHEPDTGGGPACWGNRVGGDGTEVPRTVASRVATEGVQANGPVQLQRTLAGEVGANGACLFINGGNSHRRQDPKKAQPCEDSPDCSGHMELLDL